MQLSHKCTFWKHFLKCIKTWKWTWCDKKSCFLSCFASNWVKFAYFFLIFFKFGKGNIKAFIHMFISKEFHSSLVHFSCVGKITMFFFKAGILDPVLNIRVHKYKCRGIKEIPARQRGLKNKQNPIPKFTTKHTTPTGMIKHVQRWRTTRLWPVWGSCVFLQCLVNILVLGHIFGSGTNRSLEASKVNPSN